MSGKLGTACARDHLVVEEVRHRSGFESNIAVGEPEVRRSDPACGSCKALHTRGNPVRGYLRRSSCPIGLRANVRSVEMHLIYPRLCASGFPCSLSFTNCWLRLSKQSQLYLAGVHTVPTFVVQQQTRNTRVFGRHALQEEMHWCTARHCRRQGASTASAQRRAFARNSIYFGLSSRVVSICSCTVQSRCGFLQASTKQLSPVLGP